eukprot:COSAG01_NODE_5974_length_3920_cov_2.667800_7_plen_399_part_00
MMARATARTCTAPLVMLLAYTGSSAHLTIPLRWAQPEGRLVFNISLAVAGGDAAPAAPARYYESVSRVDLGSEINMILPTQVCKATGCGGHCANAGCSCAPPGLSMPAACPDGRVPTGSHRAKNGRIYASCAASDLDVRLGGTALHLKARDVGPIEYMTSVGECGESAAAKTGFNGHAPFPAALFAAVGGGATLSLSQRTMQLNVGVGAPAFSAVRTPWSGSGPGGRLVTIVAVNGVPCGGVSPPPPAPTPAGANCTAHCQASMPRCSCHCFCVTCSAQCGNGCYDKCNGGGGCKSGCSRDRGDDDNGHREAVVAAIDSGNGAFLSYGPGSPLSAAKQFPFNLTFSGGDTLVFPTAPIVNGRPTSAERYSHNVLALGFMSQYLMTFDDDGHIVYISGQ